MIDIYFCVDNDRDIARIMNGETGNANITIYNEQTKSGKKSSWKLKNEWSAKKCPFIVICENEEAKKLFYREASIDPISDLFNYLNEN